jgi:hypothetical protein
MRSRLYDMFAAFGCRMAAGSTREPIQLGPDDLCPQRTALCEASSLRATNRAWKPRSSCDDVTLMEDRSSSRILRSALACGRTARRKPSREVLTCRPGLCLIDQAPKRAEAILRHVFDSEAVRIILGVEGPRSA